MTTSSISVRTRATAAVISLLLLVGVSLLSVTPKAYAADPGTVTGKVLDAVSGLPLAGATVSVVGAPVSTATTTSTGDYTLSAPAGDLTLTASLAGYAPKTSPQISVAAGATTAGVNFTLAMYATVRGTVTSAAAGGIAGVVVQLFDATTSSPNPVQRVTTVNGTFEITDVVPGSYKVEYDASGVSYMTRWYNLASTRDQATIVTLAPGATLDLSQTLVKASSVSGKVVDTGGIGIPSATVSLIQNGAAVAQTTTAGDGTYTIGSIAGADQYTVVAHASGYVTTWYGNAPGAATAVHFALADSSDLTLGAVILPRGGSISGHMSPSNVDFSYVVASAPGVGSYSASVNTATGGYTIADLPSGLYAVSFNANGYDPATVTNVTVTGAQAVTGIDATLVPASSGGTGYSCTVSGNVMNLSGQGLPGVLVYSASTRFTTTAADGSYSLGVLSTDTALTYGLDGYVRETRRSFCVGAGSTTVIDDVHLSRIVTIKGVVTEDGLPVAGAMVTAYAAPAGGSASTSTAADGAFTITNLPEGHYAVSASAPGSPEVFYGGGGSLATTSYYAMGEGSSTINLDIALYKAGSISGTVSMSNGTSTAGAQVTVWGSDFSKTVLAGTDGTFTVGQLPAGTYTLSAYLTKWASTSQQVVVHEGEAVSGTRLDLGNGVAVSGIVSRNNTPIPGLTVYLRTADGQLDTVTADAGGAYVFRGVPAGIYTVGTALGSDTYWLGGAMSPAHAATFAVATDPLANLDIKIPTSYDATVTVLLPGATGPATDGNVDAYDAYGDHAGQASLNVSGLATLALRPGTYALKASVAGYPTATGSVTVVDGPASAALTLTAGAELTLTPDATSSSGVGIATVVRETTTGVSATGGDHLVSLAAGKYVVAYYPVGSSGSYCGPMVWFGGTSYLTATPVTLAEAEIKTLTVHAVCAATAATHTLTGTIVPSAGVTLSAGSAYLTINDTAGLLSDSTTIDAAGTFTFASLPAGTYMITASDTRHVLVDATVQVEITTDDVTVTIPMVAGGTVAGRVLDSFGHQIAVQVNLVAGSVAQGANTSTGQFTLSGLPAGDYTVSIVPGAPYTPVVLTPVRVTPGATTDVGTVSVQLGGRITGHLPQLSGDYPVTIEATDAGGHALATTGATSGADYALWGVPAGATYVRFSGPGLVTTWWQGAASLSTATSVAVTPNGVVSGIDPTLQPVVVPTTTIQGTVTGPDGPMAGVSVWAETPSGTATSTTTAIDGTYVLTVPENVAYTVVAWFCFGTQGELGCYGQSINASRSVTVGTTPATSVDLVFGSVLAPFTQAPVPTITGDAVVGSTLTAAAGTWTPTPDSTQLQWLAEGLPIAGATATTLVLTPDLLGTHISVQVTGTKTGYVTTASTSVPTALVQPGTLVLGVVSISGTATVGSALTADAGTWGPAPVAVTYQWLRDGTVITGATSATYGVTTDDVGTALSVRATGSQPGYVDASATSAAVTVGLLTMPAATVTVSGTPTVGQTLSASVTGWPTGTDITIQWRRNGTVVATGPSYVLAPIDANVLLTVSAIGQNAGYNDGSAYQLLGTVQPGDIAGAVVVTGSGTVGTTVTAAVTWTPGLVTDTTYTWQRNGVALGTGAAYVVAPQDYGQTLTVVATSAGGVFGYTVAPAAATVPVLPGTISGSLSVLGSAVVGQTLTPSAAWTPSTAAASYTWLRDGAPAGTGGTYVVVVADAGHTIAVRAAVTAVGYTSATFTSSTVAVPLVAGSVSLPTATVGAPVTPTLSGWPDVTSTLAWSIDGRTATGATFTPLPSDSGKTLTLVVTAAKTGFSSVSATGATIVQDATMAAGAVAITPAPSVGVGSTAVLSGWAAGSTYTYSWQVAGTEASTLATYTPSASDGGRQLTVTVTATKQGFGSATSSASASVALGAISGGAASISGTPAVGATLTASSSGWSPVAVTVSYAWLRDGLPIAVTGATYAPTLADVGHALSVSATASAPGYVSATASSSPTGLVPPVAMTPGQVTIAGTAAVGSTLTATSTGWTPSTATVTYQWLRDGVAISGATTAAYVPSIADVGSTISTRGTASAPGYLTTSVTSAPTPVVPAVALTPGTVTISGAPVVGSTLTAQPGVWSPAGVSFTYQWLRDGSVIAGAIAGTYGVAIGDVGARLSVTVTGSLTGYTSASATSGGTAAVPQPTVVAGTVTISGTAAVGSTLTANPGTWSPADATLAYQWLRGGVAIAGATTSTYSPVAADLGLRLSVSVTGTKAGYSPVTATSAQTVVVSQSTVTAGMVTISGSPYVTSTLTAQPGTWSPAGVRLSYQWLRDGVAIPGETGQTYRIPLTDLGHTLGVSVTGARFGYLSATAVSAPTAAVQQPRVTAGTVTITGTPSVFSTLTAQPGTWSPANARLSYQWLRDGSPIAGANDQTYTLAAADLGHSLSVSVTGTRFGYVSASGVSAPTGPVQQARVVAGTVTVTGTATVGSRLTARPGTWSPGNAALSYQWLRDGVAIAGATGTRYTVATADVGHTLAASVTGTRAGYVPATATSAATAVVPPAQVAAGNVSITGRAVQGSFLIAQTGGWSPNVDLAYQWLRDGVVVTGARRWYYQVTSQDAGHVLTVVVTGTQPGYLPASVTSTATGVVR